MSRPGPKPSSSKWKHYSVSYKDPKGNTVTVKASINEIEVIYRLAAQALSSATGKTSVMGGAIKVEIDRKEKP